MMFETDSTPRFEASSTIERYLKRFPGGLMGLGAAALLLAVGIPAVQTRWLAQETESEPVVEVKTLPVETLTVASVDSYEVSRTYTGEIAAQRSSALGFDRTGTLVQVLVRDGDRVASGQPLAQLNIGNLETQKRQLEAQKAQAQALLLELERGPREEEIAAAQANVLDLEHQLELQKRQRSRREFLYEEGAISREQLDEFSLGADALEARLNGAQSSLRELLNGTRPEQIAAQRAVVEQLDASLADVNVDIGKSTLTAPFEGIVSARVVDEGTVVAAGQTVVQLVEDVAPEARVGMPTNVASRFQGGEILTVTLEGEQYDATVTSVLPDVDVETRTQTVVFQLEQAAVSRINPGKTVRLEVAETIPTAGIWLPIEALTQDIRGLWSTYAIVPVADTEDTYEVQPQMVEILHQQSDRALVRGTLQSGDRIVASGVHRLVPGQKVQPL